MELHYLDHLPDGFLTIDAQELDNLLKGPTLITLKGKKDPPLFVTTLLHGNEVTGFLALQQLLKKNTTLPRSLTIFIGNVAAARMGCRYLPGQSDMNRIWDGEGSKEEINIAQQILNYIKETLPIVALDLHNNSGKNPHYACINLLEEIPIKYASLFSKKMVYFITPKGVLSLATTPLCPSVTIESGLSGNSAGIEHVSNYLNMLLSLDDVNNITLDHDDIEIYHTVARIEVPEATTIGFGANKQDVDLRFIDAIDQLNFTDVKKGSLIGWHHTAGSKLRVLDEKQQDISGRYFDYTQNGEIITKQKIVPSMFSRNIKNIHQDCFGYIMEVMDRK